jgi:hypothetical protein
LLLEGGVEKECLMVMGENSERKKRREEEKEE